jgi:hypothetical protein
VVQGRTKINPKYCQTLLDKVIAAEFEVRHGIEHGSRKFVYNYAVFGGSNGFWRTEVLQFIGTCNRGPVYTDPFMSGALSYQRRWPLRTNVGCPFIPMSVALSNLCRWPYSALGSSVRVTSNKR